jgi:hypothetical protein
MEVCRENNPSIKKADELDNKWLMYSRWVLGRLLTEREVVENGDDDSNRSDHGKVGGVEKFALAKFGVLAIK